jgi:ClpA/ClpB-like protein
MLERFTADARGIVNCAISDARRLGHRYVGTEHLLLAAVGAGAAASEILRDYGLTPERVEQAIVHRIGRGAAAGLFNDLDRDALAGIGIDLDAVRARIEASFGADVLARASLEVQGLAQQRRGFLPPLLRRSRLRPGPARRRRPVNVDAAGRYRPRGDGLSSRPSGGRLPFTLPAKKVLELSLRTAVARHEQHIGVEHVTLALIGMANGPVPAILAELGVPAPALRTVILDRYPQAG